MVEHVEHGRHYHLVLCKSLSTHHRLSTPFIVIRALPPVGEDGRMDTTADTRKQQDKSTCGRGAALAAARLSTIILSSNHERVDLDVQGQSVSVSLSASLSASVSATWCMAFTIG